MSLTCQHLKTFSCSFFIGFSNRSVIYLRQNSLVHWEAASLTRSGDLFTKVLANTANARDGQSYEVPLLSDMHANITIKREFTSFLHLHIAWIDF